jgi:CheY-like chemotaxis protein
MPSWMRNATAESVSNPRAVLVVDDDPYIRRALSRVLCDHEVTLAPGGREALDLLASGKQFDVILSDVEMPEQSGVDFFEELSRRFPDSADRVVFVTGGSLTQSAQSFVEVVRTPLVNKPFDVAELRKMVETFVPRKHAAGLG